MTLKGVSDLQILMMDISFDGQYLLAVNAVPKYEITVWDITSGERYHLIPTPRVQGESSTLPLRLNFVRGEFCPTSPTRFCLMYQKSLLLYDMVPSFEKVHEEGLQKNIKMELLGQYQLDGKPSFIVWDFLSATDTSDGSEQTNVPIAIQSKGLPGAGQPYLVPQRQRLEGDNLLRLRVAYQALAGDAEASDRR
jgi:hypothetical protein